VIKHIQDDLDVDLKKEKCLFEDYNPEELGEVIDGHKDAVDYLTKKKGNIKMYNILVIIDDHADNPAFTRNSKLLHALFTRGRHHYINTIISSQVLTTISPIVRKNLISLHIFKLTNLKEIGYVVEEYSGLAGSKQTMKQIYDLATEDKYSFLIMNLKTGKFCIRFEKQMKLGSD